MLQVKPAVDALLNTKAELQAAEKQREAAAGLPKSAAGQTDYSREFFERAAFLAVSGQLNAEAYACALTDVYTFGEGGLTGHCWALQLARAGGGADGRSGAGPTFRAENSNTARHLAEFWMIEPEMAFTDLARDVAAAEAYLKHCVRHILGACKEDLDFFQKQYDNTLLQRLQAATRSSLCLPRKLTGGRDWPAQAFVICRMSWTSHLQSSRTHRQLRGFRRRRRSLSIRWSGAWTFRASTSDT